MIQKYFSINNNGFSIRCKLYAVKPEAIRKAVIFGHGFSGDKDNRPAEKIAGRILKRHKDAALLIYDWPCHGDDARGKLKLDDCDRYLGEVIDYAKTRLQAEELYGCATSFGGYLFLKYIHEHGDPFLKVALRCPAVCMYEVLTERIFSDRDIAAIKKGKPAAVGFDRKVKVTGDFLSELQTCDITVLDYERYADDIVIVHGTKDEIVPFEASRAFADKNGILFIPVEAADHRFCDPDKLDEAIDNMLEFLELR